MNEHLRELNRQEGLVQQLQSDKNFARDYVAKAEQCSTQKSNNKSRLNTIGKNQAEGLQPLIEAWEEYGQWCKDNAEVVCSTDPNDSIPYRYRTLKRSFEGFMGWLAERKDK